MAETPTFETWKARAQCFSHDGLDQSYTDTKGDGDVILLLHGYPTWSYDWVDVIPELSKDYRVIAIDWVGYGLSDKPKRHVSIKEQIDRLTAFLNHIDVKDFNLVAHDYGSSCALEILDRPDMVTRVTSVTLMNGGVILNAYRPTLTQKLLLTPLGPFISRFFTAKKVRAKLDALRGKTLTDAQFEALWLASTYQNGIQKSHLMQRYILERREHGLRWEAALANYAGPIQLVWGPLDPISGQHVLTPLQALVPKARVVALDGVGHFVPDEAPEKVVKAIRSFITEEEPHG